MRKVPDHLFSVLMLGIISQIAQVVLLRELLMVFHGNELSIGIILAAWLVWVGIGSGLGAILAERTNRCVAVLMLNAAVLLPLLTITVFFIRGLRGVFDVLPGAYLSLPDIIVSSFAVMAPVCLLIGIQFVLLARLWRKIDSAQDTSGASKTYIGEAAGNIIGGIVFTFIMVHYLNSFQSVVLAGILMLAAVLWAGRSARAGTERVRGRVRTFVAALMAAAVGALAFLGYVDDWAYNIQWRYFAPDHQLVETHQSKYGNIAIARRDDQYSFFRSGHLMFAAAGPETLEPGLEEQEAAVFAHFAMVQHARPRSVLLIGGGFRGTLGEIAKHPVKRIDYVELDEVLTRAARAYVSEATLAVLDDPRVRLVHADGRAFVKETIEKYDVILVDVPDPATAVLNRYYTKEFFNQARRLLNSEGVFVIGAVSTTGLRGAAVANRNATIYHTLKSAFSSVLPVGDRFLFYFASDSPKQLSADAAVLERRYLRRNVQADGFSHHQFHLLLEESQLRRVNWIIRNHGRSGDAHLTGPQSGPLSPEPVVRQQRAEAELPPVYERFFINSDFRPIGYYYTLMFWSELTDAAHADVLGRLLEIERWWIIPVVGFFLGLSVVLRLAGNLVAKTPDRHFAVIFAVFSTGFSTMMLQIALLFSFQSVYGFIYEMVGMIVAIFMAGLAVGTTLTHRYIKNKRSTDTLAAVQLLIALLACLIAVALPRAATVESAAIIFLLFSILTFVAGLLNGLDFPLAAECCMALIRRPEKAAGTVYGIELFGAFVGAAFASAVVAPIMGIIACCLLAAIANGTAFVILMIARRSYG
jgi:spermidine synthase